MKIQNTYNTFLIILHQNFQAPFKMILSALNINNKKSILLGIFAGFATSLYISEYFQFLFIQVFTYSDAEIIYRIIFPHNSFSMSETNNLIIISAFLSPQFFQVLVLELLNLLIKKTMLGFYRYFIMVFNLFVQGILIISVFYNSLLMIISEETSNDFVNLAFHLDMKENGKILLAFLIILITVLYLNFASKKVVKYINY